MFDSKFLENLSARLATIVPMAEEVRGELRIKIEQLLKSSFAGLDLPSREEFDAQRETLERAEKRITELEKTITKLSNSLDTLENQSSDN